MNPLAYADDDYDLMPKGPGQCPECGQFHAIDGDCKGRVDGLVFAAVLGVVLAVLWWVTAELAAWGRA